MTIHLQDITPSRHDGWPYIYRIITPSRHDGWPCLFTGHYTKPAWWMTMSIYRTLHQARHSMPPGVQSNKEHLQKHTDTQLLPLISMLTISIHLLLALSSPETSVPAAVYVTPTHRNNGSFQVQLTSAKPIEVWSGDDLAAVIWEVIPCPVRGLTSIERPLSSVCRTCYRSVKSVWSCVTAHWPVSSCGVQDRSTPGL